MGSNVNLHAAVHSSPALQSSNSKKSEVTIESLDSDDEEKEEKEEEKSNEKMEEDDRDSRLFSNSPLRNSLVSLLPSQFAFGLYIFF